jgi:hypothetical protein
MHSLTRFFLGVATEKTGQEFPLKLADKAILGMVSESPGRNASEPIGGPEKE